MKLPHSLRVVASLALSVLTAGIASAANLTWDGGGGDNNWSTGLNWDTDTAPNANDFLLFGGTTRLSPNNDFTAGRVFNSITFNSGAGAFNLSGNGIVLTNAITTIAATGNPVGGSITNNSANNETISLNTTLTRGRHYIQTSASAGALNIGGAVTRNANAMVVFLKSGGNINLTGSGLANVNGILGGWAQIGNDWAALDGSGNVVAYTAYTSLAAASTPVTSAASSNVKSTQSGGSHGMAAAGTTDINTFWWSPTTASGNQTLDPGAGNILRFGANGALFANGNNVNGNQILTVGAALGTGTLTAGGAVDAAGELTLYNAPVTGTRNNLAINSVIADNGAGAVSVNIFGYVQFPTGAINTYSGGTHIIRGRAQAGEVTCFGTGPVYVYPGGQAFLNNSVAGNWTNDFFLSGFGSNERAAGQGAIRGSGKVITGNVTLLGDTGLGGNETVSGKITGTGNLTIGFQDSGNGVEQWNMTVANDYVGDTVILANSGATSSTLRTGGADNILPHGTGKGNILLNGLSGKNATFDLGGHSQTINGLSNTTASAANNFVNSSVAGAVTLTLGDGDATSTYSGIVQNGAGGPVGITKIGSGTQTFAGANTYTGPTTVSAGSLRVTTASIGGGDYSVADGANLRVVQTAAGSSINMNSLTLGSTTGASLGLDTASFGNPSATPIKVGTLTTPDGTTTTIRLLGTALTTGTFTVLTNNPGSRVGTGSFTLDTSPRVIATVNDDTANNRVTVTITSVDNAIKWDGTASGNWDINNTGNLTWIALPSSTPTYYVEDVAGNDPVRFDDSATGTHTVNLTTALTPVSVTVSNASYTFGGNGSLAAATPLSITNGSLTLNLNNDSTLTGVISGNGSLTKSGGNTIVLSGASTYSGTTTVSGGTLRAAFANNGNSALGTVPGGAVTVASGATLDVQNASQNSIGFTNAAGAAKQFNIAGTGVGGNGAIVNNGSVNQQNALQLITLTGDASIGGPTRWDVRGNTLINPVIDLAGFTLTKTGANQISLVGVTNTGGNIIINQGILSFETASTFTGSGTITVNPGGALGQFRNFGGYFTRPIVLNGGAIRDLNGTPVATNDAPITLTADSFLDCNVGATAITILNGNINEQSGSFGLTKTNSNAYWLAGNNTYSGPTIVAQGTLLLTNNGSIAQSKTLSVSSGATLSAVGRVDGTLTLASGQTLKGNGTVAGVTVAGNGSTIAAGSSIGTLTQSGSLILQGGSTNVVEIQNTAGTAGVGYDTIAVSGNIGVAATTGNKATIKLVSLDGTGAAGAVTNFDNNQSYSWTIASGTVTNLDPTVVAVDTSVFPNDLAGGAFYVANGSLKLNFTNDHAPVATSPAIQRPAGVDAKIAIAALGTDADADALALVSFASTGTNGGTVTADSQFIYYTPGTNGDVPDEIAYTIKDVRNYRLGDTVRTASGAIEITIAPPSTNQTQNITSITTLGDGNKEISFAGIPNFTYLVQAATNLTPPVDWVTISTNTAGTNGQWSVQDLNATNYVTRFYRSATP